MRKIKREKAFNLRVRSGKGGGWFWRERSYNEVTIGGLSFWDVELFVVVCWVCKVLEDVLHSFGFVFSLTTKNIIYWIVFPIVPNTSKCFLYRNKQCINIFVVWDEKKLSCFSVPIDGVSNVMHMWCLK